MQLVFFRLHLVLHACTTRFDVMSTTQKILGTKHALSLVALMSTSARRTGKTSLRRLADNSHWRVTAGAQPPRRARAHLFLASQDAGGKTNAAGAFHPVARGTLASPRRLAQTGRQLE